MKLNKDIDLEQFRNTLPVGFRKNLAEDLFEDINNINGDGVFRDHYKETLFSYTSVLKEGKYKLKDYIVAVKYVSSKLLGNTNKQSYIVAHPNRYQNMVDIGYSENRISGHISAYNNNGLVQKILSQSMVPTFLLNADLFQKALNAQAMLMISAKSEKVRSDAANSLLTHLKVPEAQKIELEIGLSEDSSIRELRETTLKLVEQQKTMLKVGAMNVKEVAESGIIYNGECKEEV